MQPLQRLLTKRFGPLPQWVTDQLEQASLEQLEIWSERVLETPDLTTIFDPNP